MPPKGGEARAFNTVAKPSANKATYDEGARKGEEMTVCATGRSCARKKIQKAKEKGEVGSEGSSSGCKKPNEKEEGEERKPKKKKKWLADRR